MGTKASSKKKAPEGSTKKKPKRGAAKTPGKDPTFRPSRTKPALIKKMIRKMEERIHGDAVRATVGDFIRLLQLEKELSDEKPKEIRVKWVESAEEESVSET